MLKSNTDSLIYAEYKATPIEWTITEDTKTVLGYKVQKAIAKKHHYNGKGDIEMGDAIAWFAIDLPFNAGPYKYWGLPGIILEINWTGTPEQVMKAEKITFEPVDNIKPNQGVRVSKDQLEDPSKINKKWLKNARELLNNDN